MNLYEVTNGYRRGSYIRVLVVAPNEERAKELAGKKYKEESDMFGKHLSYNERYWTNLKAKLIVEDLTKEYVGEVTN